jgi:hypothetical protein
MDSVSDTDIMAKHNLSSEELMQIHAITRAVLNEVVTDGMFSKGKRIVESTVHQALVSRAKNALNTAEKDLVKAEELVDKRKAALKNAEANHDDVRLQRLTRMKSTRGQLRIEVWVRSNE